jgi:hypothetical protein
MSTQAASLSSPLNPKIQTRVARIALYMYTFVILPASSRGMMGWHCYTRWVAQGTRQARE